MNVNMNINTEIDLVTWKLRFEVLFYDFEVVIVHPIRYTNKLIISIKY